MRSLMPFLRLLARIWTVLLGCTALVLALAGATRLLIPHTPWAPQPTLVAAEPPDGATEVLPRTAITLAFATPMNRSSVEAALRIDPPTPGSLSWSPSGDALTFQPADGLDPAVTYTVSLDPAALGQWWRPLAEPVRVRFSTAPQPAVVAAMPTGAGAPADTALAVVFSQLMVPPEAVGGPAALPALSLDPPAPAATRWADQSTLLIIPTAPLAPATRYTATIGAGLTDLRGIELGEPFRWSFSTGWPAVIARTPEDGARWVSPRAPLSLRLAAPLDPALLRQVLRITPEIEGELSAETIGATQVVTFTPRTGWANDTTYSVSLVEPEGSDFGPPPALPWEFSVGPAPRLVAFFPGQGQVLPPGEAIRLVFSTPMDEAALVAGLRIEPPVDELPLTVSETEVRLRPELLPSTLYTITLAADTRDRSGEPLGAEAVVRLRTAPARPALAAPAAFANLVTLPLSRTAEVTLATTNLTALDLSLYPLDQAALVRALALGPDEWPAFSPERYGQSLARGWRLPLGAPLDQPGQLSVPVGLVDGDPLAPGAYYLRVTSPEGLRADLILLASSTRLTLRQGPGFTAVWAVDETGAPRSGLPVALYSGGAIVALGQTGPDGVWSQSFSRAPGEPPLLAIAEGGQPAVARADWSFGSAPPAQPLVRSLLFPDRLVYSPGDQLTVRGLARSLGDAGRLTLPGADTACRLQLVGEGGLTSGAATSCRIEASTGAISGSLSLSPRLGAGEYAVAAQLGDERLELPIAVAAPGEPGFELVAEPAGADELLFAVRRNGLPLAGAVVSWSLGLEPLAAPAPPGSFTLGQQEAPAKLTLSGQAPADAEGRVRLALPPEAGATAARAYTLRASLPGDDSGVAQAQGLFTQGATQVAVELPSRLIASDQRSAVALLARDGLGQGRAGAQVAVEVFRAGDRDAPVLARQAVTGADGRASVQLVQLRPGEYELVAEAGGSTTTVPFWVYGARFAGWRAADGELAIVADRERYSVGEVANLLIAAPETTGSLLLSIERGELLRSELLAVRPGQLISLPITADMAPGVTVGAILATGDQIRSGGVALPVASPADPLAVELALGAQEGMPGASLPVTITTTVGGAPVTADLLVAVVPAERVAGPVELAPFAPGPPVASTVGGLQAATSPAVSAASARRPARAGEPGYAVAIDGATGAPGLVTGRITLPAAPGRWRVTAYGANGPERVAAASAVITISLPLSYDLVAPATLRPGDSASVSVLLRNGGPVTREVTVTMAVENLALGQQLPPAQRLTLGPDGSGSLSWEVAAASEVREGRLRLTVDTPGLRESLAHSVAIVPPVAGAPSGETLIGAGPLTTTIALDPAAGGELAVAVAPGLRAALGDQARALAALAEPSVEERAALALIAAGLAADQQDEAGAAWATTAREASAALEALQNEDGGWGWWPGAPSRPFVTAFVLEAQAAVGAALGQGASPNLQAVAYLESAAPAADVNTRAYRAYVLSLVGQADPDAAELAGRALGPDGLAYLAMALPAPQREPLLDRLQAAAERSTAAPGAFRPASWAGPEPAELPRGPTVVTAAAAQALREGRPTAAELPGAEASLLAAWGVDGWRGPFAVARVAAALLDGAPAAGDGPARVRLDGAPILGAGDVFSDVLRTALPVASLPTSPTLTVESAGPASYLLATSAPGGELAPVPGLSLLQELVDPASGTALDPTQLRAGQLVALRLTAVVAQPMLRADLAVELPAGFEAATAPPRAPFQAIVAQPDRPALLVRGADLGPGVYSQLVFLRAVAAGSFAAPPARLIDPYDAGRGAVAPAGLNVTIRP